MTVCIVINVAEANALTVYIVSFTGARQCCHCIHDCLQDQVLRFAWSSIEEYEIDEESMSFNFLYSRDNKKPRWVKIMTNYVRFIHAEFFMYVDEQNCSYAYVSLVCVCM